MAIMIKSKFAFLVYFNYLNNVKFLTELSCERKSTYLRLSYGVIYFLNGRQLFYVLNASVNNIFLGFVQKRSWCVKMYVTMITFQRIIVRLIFVVIQQLLLSCLLLYYRQHLSDVNLQGKIGWVFC